MTFSQKCAFKARLRQTFNESLIGVLICNELMLILC